MTSAKDTQEPLSTHFWYLTTFHKNFPEFRHFAYDSGFLSGITTT